MQIQLSHSLFMSEPAFIHILSTFSLLWLSCIQLLIHLFNPFCSFICSFHSTNAYWCHLIYPNHTYKEQWKRNQKTWVQFLVLPPTICLIWAFSIWMSHQQLLVYRPPPSLWNLPRAFYMNNLCFHSTLLLLLISLTTHFELPCITVLALSELDFSQ